MEILTKNLLSKKTIRSLLKNKSILPLKQLGQNFLVSEKILKEIIRAGELQSKDIVLEIGPGIGALTKELAKKVNQVIAIEKDWRLIGILKENLKDFNNIKIIHGDILRSDLFNIVKDGKKLKTTNYKLISNLPYNIATEIIKRFLESKNPPELMVLTLQKEVGERICSKPPKMERLGVLVGAFAKTEIIITADKNAFWPSPKVDSAILKIIPNSAPKLPRNFISIVKAGFSQPRKQLKNNLSKELKLSPKKVGKLFEKSGIKLNSRAENLGLKDWLKLAKTLTSNFHFLL